MDPYRLDNLDKGWKGAETEVAGEDFEDNEYSDIVVGTEPLWRYTAWLPSSGTPRRAKSS